MNTIKIVVYIARNGKEPFNQWLDGLDVPMQSIIRARISRVRLGNFGDCKLLKSGMGVWELRIDFGPGYRIYFGKLVKQGVIVILLTGGDKKTQKRDIEKAINYWCDYKEVYND